MIFAIASVVVLFAFVSRYCSPAYRYAGTIALAGHLLVSVAVLPRVPYEWDVPRFHAAALRILHGGATDPLSAVDTFATFQALVYVVFSPAPTTISIVNGFLGVLVPIPACHLARRLYPSLESTDALSLVVLFLPLPFLFTSLPMRDAVSTLIAVTLLALVVRAIVDGRYWSGLAGVPLWGMLFLLREELAFVVLLGATGAVLVRLVRRHTGREVSLTTLVAATAPVGAVGFLLFSQLFPIGALNARLQYRARGGAAYLDFMRYDSWIDVLLAAPTRAIYFQFAPFPLHVNSAFDLVAALSLPAVIVLAVTAYLSLGNVESETVVEVLILIFYFGGVIGYGLIDSNFGTTVRHRTVFVFLLGVMSAPVLESWLRSIRRWIDDRDHYRRDDGEQHQEAEELDARTQVRSEH